MFSYKIRIKKFKEKSRSLQNQPSRMEVSADQDLEFLMYGRNAVKYNSEFKHSQVINRVIWHNYEHKRTTHDKKRIQKILISFEN